MEILLSVDSVLNQEHKTSTYKFALVCSLLDYIIENPDEQHKNGFHYLPLIYIAKRFLYYYYPLAVYKEGGIKQTTNPGFAVYTKIYKFIKDSDYVDYVLSEPEAIIGIQSTIENNRPLTIQLISLLIGFRTEIIKNPLRYIKVGGNTTNKSSFHDFKIRQKNFSLFGLYNTHLKSIQNLDYKEVLSNSKWTGKRKIEKLWTDFETEEKTFLKIGHFTYFELAKLRFYIRDVTIKRWIEFSVSGFLRNDGKSVYNLIQSFKLIGNDRIRDSATILQIRRIADTIFEPLVCIYCEINLTEFELDHFVPWSKFPVNYFWNLFPACKTCNRQKSDKIIEIDDKIEGRLGKYLKLWTNKFSNDEELWRKFGGREFEEIRNLDSGYIPEFLLQKIKMINQNLL